MAHPWHPFVSPETGQPLKVEAAGAQLVTEDGAECWSIVNGIPDFVQWEGPDLFGERMREEHWVERNWQGQQTHDPSNPLERFGREIAEAGGVILEIAAGLGGGNLSSILYTDDAATVLVNDLSRMILEDWQAVLRCDWLWQRELDPNEGGLPQEADRHCVRLRVTVNIVVASKPGG